MLEIFVKLVPIIVLAFIGFSVQKTVKGIDISSIGKLLIYFLTPAIVFLGAYKVSLEIQYLIIPFVVFFILLFSTTLLNFLLKKFYPKEKNALLSFISATSNIGYFGLPLILSLFGEEVFPLVVISFMGFTLSESIIGAFVMIKAENKKEGNNSIKNTFFKVIKIPSIGMFLLGILFNFFEIPIGDGIMEMFKNIKSAYIVNGMLLIGISFASLKIEKIEWGKVGKMLLIKHLWQPFWFILIINFLLLFLEIDPIMKKIMLIQSFCPIAGSLIIYSSVFKQKMNNTTLALLISMILAFITIPICIELFL